MWLPKFGLLSIYFSPAEEKCEIWICPMFIKIKSRFRGNSCPLAQSYLESEQVDDYLSSNSIQKKLNLIRYFIVT